MTGVFLYTSFHLLHGRLGWGEGNLPLTRKDTMANVSALLIPLLFIVGVIILVGLAD